MSHLVYPTAAPLIWNPRMPGGMRDELAFCGGTEFPGTTRYNDASGRDNTGTLTGMDPATDWGWDSWLQQWTLDFDGSDDVVTSAYSPINGLTTMSCSFWVNQRSTGGSAYGMWIGSKTAYNAATGFFIGRDIGGFDQCFFCGTKQTFPQTIAAWQHLAFLWSSGAPVQIFRNGVLVATSSNISGTLGNFQLELGNNTTNALAAACSIADPLIFNRALTPPEIQWLADPTHHLRVPWRRTVWPVVSAGPTFNPAWARNCNNLIGAGI